MALQATTKLAALALSCALPLAAQQTGKPDPARPATPAGQTDISTIQELEQKPADPVVQDPVAAAKRQLEQMEKELAFLRTVAEAGLVQRVKQRFLADRIPNPRTLDLGIAAIPEPIAPTPAATGPRLMNDAEREQHASAVFVVEGEPVTQAEVDTMVAYFRSRPGDGADAAEADAIRALVTQKAALARFRSAAPAALEKIEELAGKVAGGEDFAAVARQHSMCPSAANGGNLGSFGRGVMDPVFERAAFTTPVGEVSGVVQSGFGYHLVKVTSRDDEKGEVAASHVLVSFDRNTQAIQQTMMQARQGQVDIAFVDEQWLARSPF